MAGETARARVAILVSGTGTNMEAILDASPPLPADFVAVISSRRDAPALEKARSRGIPALVVDSRDHASRPAYDAALRAELEHCDAEYLVLAGFMRILTDGLVTRYRGRILNIHPSLLPAFPGLHAQRQALEHGVRVAGCTVHFVVEGAVDGGPIVDQAAVPVFDHDDVESLSARIQLEEHRLYPAAVGAVLRGEVWLEGDRTARASACDEPGA